MVYVDGERCKGCGVCVDACPSGAIRLVDGVATIEQSLCRECQACVDACPQGAILAISEPVTEGERVPQRVPITQPAPAVRPTPPTTWQRPARTAWLGTALAFVGTEVLPRVVASLLDAWDRRASRTSLPATSQGTISPTASSVPITVSRGGGRRWRLRRRGGQ
ncbi:MAG: 4Fe-4S binding protein [Anaerolineae bacterium]|jgi:NAD-dependent dihydropyrimidine dehydrogenase PreA subunit|nr:4Fe-4S binding protein [Anaerolineae bacterium]MDH7472825.1 4Fe-4S binding protein [Anaerolineae bacterium]